VRILIEAEAHVAGEFEVPVAAGDVDDAGFGTIVGAASRTCRGQRLLRRSASRPVKRRGMCCTMRMGSGKLAGILGSRSSRAAGPPVEVPMTTIFGGRDTAGGRVSRGSGEGIAADGAGLRGKEGEDFGQQLAGEGPHAFAMPFCAPGLAT